MSNRPGFHDDGDVDYSRYTVAQLAGALARIDIKRYPLNFALAKAALIAHGIPLEPDATLEQALDAARRAAYLVGASVAQDSSPQKFLVAFAPEAGFWTWLGPSRNDFRLVGYGSIHLDGERIVLKGRRFGVVFGLPLRRKIRLDRSRIVNVEQEANIVRFECRDENSRLRSVALWLADEGRAAELIQLLPVDKSLEFEPQLAEHVAFEERLMATSPRTPVTWTFAGTCAVMFAVTLTQGAALFNGDGVVQLQWGANFAPYTMAGQWWRLLTYSLLHLGIFHFAFNMWALVSFGGVAERLYGSYRYAIIMVFASIVGGLTSIAMHAQLISLGSSGVILGILGALLVSHERASSGMPTRVGRSLRNSTFFFTACALVAGLLIKGIDNAVHVGGLVAGGFIGWSMQSPRRLLRIAAPAGLALASLAGGVVLDRQSTDLGAAEAQYWRQFEWLVQGESDAVNRWVELGRLVAQSKISDDALANRIDSEVLPFWREANLRVKSIRLRAGSKAVISQEYLMMLTGGRQHALELCVSGLHKHDTQIVQNCMNEMAEVDRRIAERKRGS